MRWRSPLGRDGQSTSAQPPSSTTFDGDAPVRAVSSGLAGSIRAGASATRDLISNLPSIRPSAQRLLCRFDRLAADLDAILFMFAIGLALLDATCLVAQRVVDWLPPMATWSLDNLPSLMATGTKAPLP